MTERTSGRALRPVLWLLLLLTATANAVASSVNVVAGIVFGVAALSCATALAVDHYRHRRS